MSAPSEIYRRAVDRVVTRVGRWSGDEAATAIPACPGWTAHDLVAHLAGGAADHAAGRLDGFPGPAWTSRHIEERSSRPTRDVVAELLALAAQTAARCDERRSGPNSSWDAYIHERDLGEAFDGRPTRLDDDGHQLLHDVTAFITRHAPFEVDVEPVDDAVRVTLVHGQPHVAVVEAAAAFRAVTGRGDRGELQGWRWVPEPPPAPVLAELSLF